VALASEADHSDEMVLCIAIGNDHVFAGGRFGGETYFGSSLVPLVKNGASDTSDKGGDGVIIKYSQNDGKYVWHVALASPGDDEVSTLAFNQPDRLLVGGGIGPGPKNFLGKNVLGHQVQLGPGAFVALFSAFHGGFQWVELVGRAESYKPTSAGDTMLGGGARGGPVGKRYFWEGDSLPGGCCTVSTLAINNNGLLYGGGPGVTSIPPALKEAQKVAFVGSAYPPPQRVQFPMASRTETGKIVLSWNPVPESENVTSYTIYSKSEEAEYAVLQEHNVTIPYGNYTFSSLRPGVSYGFKVMTHSRGGRSTPSAPTGKVLFGFGPPPKVLIPIAKLEDDKVTLVWRKPSVAMSGEITGYTIVAQAQRHIEKNITTKILHVDAEDLAPPSPDDSAMNEKASYVSQAGMLDGWVSYPIKQRDIPAGYYRFQVIAETS